MDNKNLHKDIAKAFRFSNSPDELFDNFRTAIDQKINDFSLYNALLWNKALSVDEVLMFAEKICKEIPGLCFDTYLSVAKILDSKSFYGNNKEIAFDYIKKAADSERNSTEPYVIVYEMYNKELDLPPFDKLAAFFEKGFNNVKEKSKLSFLLARLYGKVGEIEKGRSYQKMGEEYLQKGE
ncbi:MAG: hypothetical protein P8Z35_19015 [Ignavibacteriaceae bacterium]